MQVAADHEATVASRTEELKALADATKMLKDTSSGAEAQTYSFLQRSGTSMRFRLRTSADLRHSEVVAMVTRLAKRQHSAALSQLASRIAAVVRFGSASSADPFAKVKGLIEQMISKLERQMGSEASEKAYCDEQMSKTEAKKGELEEDVQKMTAKIDQSSAMSAELKSDIAELESQLSALAKEQAEMDSMRQEENKDYVQAKADLELGLSGVRKALKVLREYYSGDAALLQDESQFSALMQQPAMPEHHSKASGAGTNIVGILEVVESDFATNLAKEESEESDAQSAYDEISQDNKVTETGLSQDAKYKTQEAKALDKRAAELGSDSKTTKSELAAVNEYYAKIKDRCVAKPETYEERKARREAEIRGLKEALNILENETAFVQRKSRRGFSRGFLDTK